jgi:hypothetical protein
MKCPRCMTELPGQAQFCLKCGTPVAAAPAVPHSNVTMSRPVAAARPFAVEPPRSRKGLYAAIAAVVLLLAVAAFFGLRRGNVVTASGRTPEGSRIMDTSGRIGRTAPLTTSAGTPGPAPLDPADVIDYIAFLRDIERERVTLVKNYSGQLLALEPVLSAGHMQAYMQPDEQSTKDKFSQAEDLPRQKMTELNQRWDALAQRFRTKTPPQACQQLAADYYQALGSSQRAYVTVSGKLMQAMADAQTDPGKAMSAVGELQAIGAKESAEADTWFNKSDEELARTCDKYRIKKDFDIKPDGGSASPFGIGR